MRVAFRADASVSMGIGHVMRCLTLSDALKRRGAEVQFVSRQFPENLRQLFERRGQSLVVSGEGMVGADLTQAEDASQTLAALAGAHFDWIVVDHYALDAAWESAVRSAARQVLAIDDIADRTHDCDVLLDQNLYPDMHTRYRSLVPAGARQLLGPQFALLRPEFARLRASMQPRSGKVRRIMVLFGGTDEHDLTTRSIEALRPHLSNAVHVDVVIGAGHPGRERIRSLCASIGARCHVQSEQVAELMAAADLAVGAAGSTSWERCCLGLPSLCVSVADNQYPIGAALQDEAACVFMGDRADASVERISEVLRGLLADEKRLHDMSRKAAALVDGEGASRVCDVIWGMT